MEHYDAIKEASDDKVDTAVGLILNTSVVIIHNNNNSDNNNNNNNNNYNNYNFKI
jgi:hypothetical protein